MKDTAERQSVQYNRHNLQHQKSYSHIKYVLKFLCTAIYPEVWKFDISQLLADICSSLLQFPIRYTFCQEFSSDLLFFQYRISIIASKLMCHVYVICDQPDQLKPSVMQPGKCNFSDRIFINSRAAPRRFDTTRLHGRSSILMLVCTLNRPR